MKDVFRQDLAANLSRITCSMCDFEVCSNGAAEVSAQTAAPAVASPTDAIQSEAGSSPKQAASDTEEGTGGRDSCSTDDDQFSDVGEAADTEVMTDHRPPTLACTETKH